MAAVDIIIPIYNSAAYLAEAVESILNQTFSDWNLILVNDGSTDRSGEICDSYAAKDSRIHVFHTENHGVSHARNVGIQNSQSEWIMFLDSDDTVEPSILEALFKHSNGMDIVGCGCTITDRPDRQFVNKTTCFSGIAELTDLYCNNIGITFFNVVWGKIYRKSCLVQLFDENMPHGEDLMFNLVNFPKLTYFCIIPDILYNYSRRNETSLTSRLWLDTLDFEWKVYLRTARTFENAPQIIHTFLTRCRATIIGYFYNIVNFPVLTKQQKLIILTQKLESDIFTIKSLNSIGEYEPIWSLICQKNIEAIYDCLYQKLPSDLGFSPRQARQ